MNARRQTILNVMLIVSAMAGIFIVDTLLSLEIAVAVFYTLIILVASRTLRRHALLASSALCCGLTVLSFLLTEYGAYHAGLINLGISLAVIVMCTYLVVKMAAARAAAHDAQTQLMRIARIKSLAGLTTAIAHEVNQPLAAIATSGNACQRWLAQQPPNLDKARQALTRICLDAERASRIIARVRSLTKGEPPQRSTFALNDAIVEVITLSRADIHRHGVELHIRLCADLPDAWADRTQVQQVVANLLLNAIEAMTTASVSVRRLWVTTALRQNFIVVSVADSGPGISPQIRPHLFEAFWTTKAHGVGVGLSLAHAIIEANGGQIAAHQAPEEQGGGAMFEFSVPVAPAVPIANREQTI